MLVASAEVAEAKGSLSEAAISAEAGGAPRAAKEPVKVYRLIGGDRR
jgi:hypothetical protein